LVNTKNQKVNYDKILRQMIQTWQAGGVRPKLIIHSCCAPCSTYTLEFLSTYADVTIYFANSNIHPEAEYRRRALVKNAFVHDFNQRTNQNVAFLEEDYRPNDFIQMVMARELQDEPEKGLRCSACFQLRLDLVAEKAVALGYDYFGSALTLSPQKDSQLINEIGLDAQKIYAVKYLPSDFKKNKGYERSVQMCREYDIYRQCYCGCVFAAKQQGIDLKAINQEAKAFLKAKQEVNG
ncbi:MAG: epoxyqueuosine reductase QueH, partial [Lactococcus sp.]|nr:epoxyqueuosine reductase QueH [Lactococcus sp.]